MPLSNQVMTKYSAWRLYISWPAQSVFFCCQLAARPPGPRACGPVLGAAAAAGPGGAGGAAFGAAATGDSFGAAVALAIGIGIQNFPEGAAVSVPLRREGMSKKESFWWGQLSALVEPISAVIGAAVVVYMTPVLPYALAFAAGAMIFVVVEELVPEAHRGKNGDIATMGVMFGFTIMMVLDVALG